MTRSHLTSHRPREGWSRTALTWTGYVDGEDTMSISLAVSGRPLRPEQANTYRTCRLQTSHPPLGSPAWVAHRYRRPRAGLPVPRAAGAHSTVQWNVTLVR